MTQIALDIPEAFLSVEGYAQKLPEIQELEARLAAAHASAAALLFAQAFELHPIAARFEVHSDYEGGHMCELFIPRADGSLVALSKIVMALLMLPNADDEWAGWVEEDDDNRSLVAEFHAPGRGFDYFQDIEKPFVDAANLFRDRAYPHYAKAIAKDMSPSFALTPGDPIQIAKALGMGHIAAAMESAILAQGARLVATARGARGL